MTEVTFVVEIDAEGATLLERAAEVWKVIEELWWEPKVISNSLTHPIKPSFLPGHGPGIRTVEPTTIHTEKRGRQQGLSMERIT